MERTQVWDAWLSAGPRVLSALRRDNLSHRETLLDCGSFAASRID
jgi:hypothetical protein